MASRSEKALRLDGSDGIFRLPSEILQRIFFFLPVEDAVSLSATSKTWQNLWTSLPVLNFSFDHEENDTIEDFVASIEASMQTLRSCSAIIESFFLTINPPENEGLNSLELESHLHDWLSLVMKNYVKEIDLRVFESPDINNHNIFYTLPQSVFTSKSLVKLRLIGCKVPANISFPESRLHEFLCLKEIILEDVVARDDQIQDLVNQSRNSLEKLTIKTFDPIEHLSLMFFSKLDFVEVNVMTLHIDQALNLDTLILCGIHKVYAFGVGNIKTLKCLTWDTNAYKWIKALISSLPFLETVQLTMIENHQTIEIKSHCLVNFFLCESERLEGTIVVAIDAPRLSKIYFTGFSFPAIKMLRRSEKVEFHHLGHSSGGIDSSQLFRLGKVSNNVFHPVLEIHLHRIFVEYLLNLEELKEHRVVCYPTNVTMVVLRCIPAASNYSSFLDALFWTCHPSHLVVLMNKEETLQSPHRASFIRYLLNELMNRANNPTCCAEPEKPKCWKHYIADVRCQLYKSTHVFEAHELTGIPVEMAENRAFHPVETNNKGIAIQFSLMWLPYLF